jgi:hypothetical protein
MHLPTDEIPVRIDVPGAVARQARDFGVAAGALGAEHFTIGAGTDLAPLLKGLDGDACASAHWGYVITGRVVVDYSDGASETCDEGDVFYWPPGHSVRTEQDTQMVLFSPQADHTPVIDHIRDQLAAT